MAIFYSHEEIKFKEHPKFSGVKIAILVDSQKNDKVSISILLISPGKEVPIHVHEAQIDSIYVVEGVGEVYINDSWRKINPGDYVFVLPQEKHGVRNIGNEDLKLFIVHSPPLF